LQPLNQAFQELSDSFSARLSGKSAEYCHARPSGPASCWSACEIVEHLVLTYRGTVSQVEKYLARGKVTARKSSWRETAARVLVLDFEYLPRGQKAPEFVMPGRVGLSALDGSGLSLLLGTELSNLDQQLVRAEESFGRQTLAPHFRLGPLSAAQWRRFHQVHGRLHLSQLTELQKNIAARE
jgi:hypothetical protein